VLARLGARVLPRWDGVSTLPGWDRLLDALDRDLAAIDPGYAICQIKNKLGGLRVYVELSLGLPDERCAAVYARIRAAETQAATVCETCGAPGRLRSDGGWYRVACNQHAAPHR
jgi:hypothetical protein